MSSAATPGPFPAVTPKPPTAGSADRMEYMRSYQYIFENPNWMMNVLWGFLCIISTSIIPIIGQLVLLGYQYEVIEALFLARGARYPDFDINRFADYLGRSIWPFLVQLIASLVIAPVIVLFSVVFMIAVSAGAAAGGDNFGPIIAIFGFAIAFVVIFALALAMAAVLMPMTLKAGLQQDLGAAFDFAWIKDFIAKTWLEMVLSFLFLAFTGFLFTMLGLLLFCIGMYAGIAVVMLAQAHIQYQLYSLYLARGGTPIPLKVRPVLMPAPPGYAPQGFSPPPPPAAG